MNPHKVHIAGGPGSGKTTLARCIADTLDLPLYDLDGIGLEVMAAGRPFVEEMAGEAQRIAQSDRWVCEGAYMGWAEPLFQRAELVIWLDVPRRTASYRIISRHVKATLARNNRFPGWRRLYRFWRWSAMYYANRADPGLNAFGTPNTKQTAIAFLEPHRDKLAVCCNNKDIELLLAQRFSVSYRGSP